MVKINSTLYTSFTFHLFYNRRYIASDTRTGTSYELPRPLDITLEHILFSNVILFQPNNLINDSIALFVSVSFILNFDESSFIVLPSSDIFGMKVTLPKCNIDANVSVIPLISSFTKFNFSLEKGERESVERGREKIS